MSISSSNHRFDRKLEAKVSFRNPFGFLAITALSFVLPIESRAEAASGFAKSPRSGYAASKPGAYALLSRVTQDVVDPGGTVTIELYVSGYGEIGPAKLAFYPSADIFDLSKSSISFDLKRDGPMVTWGGQEVPLDSVGKTLDLSGGLQEPGWSAPTLFFDSPDSVHKGGRLPQLVTEVRHVNAPIVVTLVVRDGIPSGGRFCRFQLTYFNGNEWATNSDTVAFSVTNFFQRHEVAIWSVGMLATTLGIIVALKEMGIFRRWGWKKD